jgi:DNA-binding CsgD family transcriptional regulator
MKQAALLLDFLDASYRLDLGGREYVENLVEHAVPLLDRGLGVVAYTYDARDPAHPVVGDVGLSSRFDPAWLQAFYHAVEVAQLDRADAKHPTGFRAWSHLTCAQVSGIPKMRAFLPLFEHFGGARDVFALNALDASGHGLWLGAPWPRITKAPAERATLFARAAAHLRAACRLRRNDVLSKPRSAILSAAGEVLHIEGDTLQSADAGGEDVRDELRRAAMALDRARSREGRRDVERATRGWRPLVLSRWSVLDQFDSDGRRFLVAVDNRPPTRPPRRDLSEREHQVMTHAHLGHTNKVIAYELGLSASTVRVLLHRAARKLGATTRGDAIARFDMLSKRRASGDGEAEA